MPADYKSRTVRPEKKPLPGFVWLLIGLAIGLFIKLIVYLDKQPENETSFAEAVQKELDQLRQRPAEPPADPEPEPETDNNENRKPRFNFYTILPELEVLIPDSELRIEHPKNRQTTTPAAQIHSSKRYVLQAGSFKNRADADRLKAQLTLIALDASIQPVSINSQQWYRVRVGPFDNTRELHDSLNRLQQHGIQAMAMELKTE